MNAFTEISLIIAAAVVVSGFMRLLKQQLILGYIITGLLVGSQVLKLVPPLSSMNSFSQIGITILLFIVGLGLSPKVLKEVGKTAFFIGIGQVVLTFVFGYLTSLLLGFSQSFSIIISAALTFSSTIVVLKLLSDKRETEKLYGRISIGILLTQDIVATVILVVISAFSKSGFANPSFLTTVLGGIGVSAALVFISIYVLPKMGVFFARSQEYLFLFSVGWGLGIASLFSYLGFSKEIGALVAGVSLSMSPYSREIAAKLKPLRDFFVILFFIYLGAGMQIKSLNEIVVPSAVFAIFVLFSRPIIIMTLSGLFGYNKKTGFFTGISLSQISEFSLILIFVAMQNKQIGDNALPIITIVSLGTVAISTYVISKVEALYLLTSKYLSVFEKRRVSEEQDILSSYDVVLFGCNRVGYDFLRIFKKLGQSFLVVDFDPDIIKKLTKSGINCRYGDAEDAEFLEELNLENVKLVASTIPEFETNAFLLSDVRKVNIKAVVIMISYSIENALKLYEKGATYVILPHFIGGHFAAELSQRHGFDIEKFSEERERHIAYLNERKLLGHKHPEEVIL